MRAKPALPFELRVDPETGLECCPTLEAARSLTPEALDRLHAYLDDRLGEHLFATSPEGTAHSRSIMDAIDRVDGHFRRQGRGIFLATDLGVHYPDAPPFAPDLMAVLDVSLHDRSRWRVDVEGRGIDFALEVLVDGDRRKDLVRNVRLYAELGIPEYLVFVVRDRSLMGWRLDSPDARTYTRIVPQWGRLPSRVLGLEFGVMDGALRVWQHEALLPSTGEVAQLLGKLADERGREAAAAQADAAAAQAEAAAARQDTDRALDALRTAVRGALAARGVAPGELDEALLAGCTDAARLAVALGAALDATATEPAAGVRAVLAPDRGV